jgi:hypothetical protein
MSPSIFTSSLPHIAIVTKSLAHIILALGTGDDVKVEPANWPELIADAFESALSLMCLILKDEADPGFPSFPVLRADVHFDIFGRLLPNCFVNQGK